MLQLKDNIKKIRKLMKLKQLDFAEKMKVTLGMQKSYETGAANPDTVYIQRLSEEIGMEVWDLMNRNIPISELEKLVKKGKKVKSGSPDDAENYKDKYLRSLEDDKLFLKNLISSNLIDIDRNQQYLLAELKAAVKRSTERFVKDDEEQTQKELDKISIYAAEYLGLGAKAGIASRDDKDHNG